MATEETLFAQALDRPAGAERAAFLARVCGGDAALRRAVEALLDEHERPPGVLDAPPPGVDAQAEIVVAGQIDDDVGGRARPQPPGEPGLGPAAGQALQLVQPARQGTPNYHEKGKLSPGTDSPGGPQGPGDL